MTDNFLQQLKSSYRRLRNLKNRFTYKINNIYLAKKQSILSEKKFIPSTKDLIECFQLPENILHKTLITSFYNSNIPNNIVTNQKRIFDLFQLPLVQINGNETHAAFLSNTLTGTDKEYVLFFDVDAIPLQKEAVFLALKELEQGFVLLGALQTANHINNGKNNYAGPFFMGINTKFYREAGYPSLKLSEEFDVAAVLTNIAEKQYLPIKYWVPTHVEVKKWKLYRIGYFGLGTIYNGLVYHAFEGREGNTFRFISKCKKVLKAYR